jgi:DNA-binding CsgD family transcriptional regulator
VDFEACGASMRRWRLDSPVLLPWRTDAARTWLRLGEPETAARLANAQLRRLPPGASRARGASLRILAETGAPSQRVRLLRQAADTLRTLGDHAELAPTLTDLSRAYRDRGLGDPARAYAHRARQIASRCGLPLAPAPDSPPPDRDTVPGDTGAGTAHWPGLSAAERRVVMLATQGLTNRQIAAELHLTVSTVEQHLTKIYRKLRVRRRADLPIAVPSGAESPEGLYTRDDPTARSA